MMTLYIVIVVVFGLLIERGIEAWQKVRLAKHGYREERNGSFTKL